MEWFIRQPVVLQALLATLFTYGVTALGAGMVLFFKTINRKVLDGMPGFAGGVMIAASFWSLLAPSLEMAEAASERTGVPGWVPAVIGFLAGGMFIRLVDRVLPHLHIEAPEPEGPKTGKTTLYIVCMGGGKGMIRWYSSPRRSWEGA